MSDRGTVGSPARTGRGSTTPDDGQHEQEGAGPISSTETPAAPTARGRTTQFGDRLFGALATGAGVFVVAVIAAIGIFLVIQAVPALIDNDASFLFSRSWTATTGDLSFGVLDLLSVTVFSSLFALVIAMPIALGIALFLTQYAPKPLARPMAYVVDLLAAVPSIIYGLWGVEVLAPALGGVAQWFNDTLGFIPIFGDGNVSIRIGQTIFTAGIVLAVMLLPIITAVSREVFSRTPTPQVEGALALGATKWEVVRTTVLPFGKAGYISASMLGLGRALGETIALLIILSPPSAFFGWSLFDGGDTIASKIARSAGEFNDPKATGAYIAAGLVLFVLTFVVNAIARAIVAGRKEYE